MCTSAELDRKVKKLAEDFIGSIDGFDYFKKHPGTLKLESAELLVCRYIRNFPKDFSDLENEELTHKFFAWITRV